MNWEDIIKKYKIDYKIKYINDEYVIEYDNNIKTLKGERGHEKNQINKRKYILSVRKKRSDYGQSQRGGVYKRKKKKKKGDRFNLAAIVVESRLCGHER
jgi:hypothetical protein